MSSHRENIHEFVHGLQENVLVFNNKCALFNAKVYDMARIYYETGFQIVAMMEEEECLINSGGNRPIQFESLFKLPHANSTASRVITMFNLRKLSKVKKIIYLDNNVHVIRSLLANPSKHEGQILSVYHVNANNVRKIEPNTPISDEPNTQIPHRSNASIPHIDHIRRMAELRRSSLMNQSNTNSTISVPMGSSSVIQSHTSLSQMNHYTDIEPPPRMNIMSHSRMNVESRRPIVYIIDYINMVGAGPAGSTTLRTEENIISHKRKNENHESS